MPAPRPLCFPTHWPVWILITFPTKEKINKKTCLPLTINQEEASRTGNRKTQAGMKVIFNSPNRPVSLLLSLHRALTARRATHSNVESPIKRLRIPNSTSRDPAPAVQVSLMLSGGTPVFRFTCVHGTLTLLNDPPAVPFHRHHTLQQGYFF